MKYILSAFLVLFLIPALPVLAADQESAYDRVMRTSTLRCGYFVWPPFIDRDPNSKKLKGLFVDLTERIGSELSLKVDWAEEIAFDSMFEGLAAGRYDAICGPLSPLPARARSADFSTPIAYGPLYIYARADDKRFDSDHAKINDPVIRIAILEGEASQIIAREDFPKAATATTLSMAGSSGVMMDLVHGKADVAFLDPISASLFIKSNPGVLRRVEGGPFRTYPIAYTVPVGNYPLKRLFDITIDSLNETGYIDRLLKRYLPPEDDFLRVRKPYETP